jgi:phosphoribosylanthranilate isomerase
VAEPPRVKICGLTRNGDARTAEALGADFLGMVLTDGFARSVPRDRAAGVVEGTSAPRVAVVVDETPAAAAGLAAVVDATVVQLHGSETPADVAVLRDLGEWVVWKAVRAATLDDVREAVDRYGEIVEGLLVEGWREGVVGGGGARLLLEPEAVRALVPSGLAFVLAGGLEPTTVEAAVARFRPDVVDVSSGVERAVGEKDPRRMETFVRSAKQAFTSHSDRPT